MILVSNRLIIITTKFNVTVNIVLDSKKFSENVNVWQAVLQKAYNIWS